MSDCNSIQSKFSEYLDGRLTGHEMQSIAAHVETCRDCGVEWSELKQAQTALTSLRPVPEPEDLLLRIRVAVSQERARSRRSVFQSWKLIWDNTVGPFILQATAGFASAVLLLGTVTVLEACLHGRKLRRAPTNRLEWQRRRIFCISPQRQLGMTRSVKLPRRLLSRPTSTERAKSMTIGSFPVRWMRGRAPKLRICCCGVILSRHASSVSRFVDLRSCRSRVYLFADSAIHSVGRALALRDDARAFPLMAMLRPTIVPARPRSGNPCAGVEARLSRTSGREMP